ncbi:ribonuclease HI family protein [Patescibacteria group bacterium]|nr:ribonuclease HI family protein [Patescibacteria group bacterium]
MMISKGLKIYSDGGARGNPGPSASAFVVIEEGKVIFKKSKYLGKNTNNFAEYTGVRMALDWLRKKYKKKGGERITLNVDSQLVVKQLSGEYKVKSKNLKPLILKIKELEKTVGARINYLSVPREKNKLADYLVNEVLDENS